VSAAVSPELLLMAALLSQGGGASPFRKSDLVRLLSGSEMSSTELAQLVRRNCLTFTPTARDRLAQADCVAHSIRKKIRPRKKFIRVGLRGRLFIE